MMLERKTEKMAPERHRRAGSQQAPHRAQQTWPGHTHAHGSLGTLNPLPPVSSSPRAPGPHLRKTAAGPSCTSVKL